MGADDITERVARVRERIAAAAARAGRDATTVRLIAVTKGVDAARVDAALRAGVTDVGENRVQEAQHKRRDVEGQCNWHLIGHLQTNKAKTAAALFDAMHSVDSDRVARALAVHRPEDAPPIAALVEVEMTGAPARTGVAADAAEPVVRACAGLPGLHVLGLMTIAPFSDDSAVVRDCFARLRSLRDRIEDSTGWALPELSMGMSGDYEIAVEEGATMVRVGRAIFGERA